MFVKLVRLEKRIKDKVSKYSLGMRQRLGVAQAILHKPNLLILDEPTNGLDPEGIKELRELLKDLAKKEKMAIFISSHNLAEIETLCNKVCIIQNGEVIETTDLKKVKQEVKTHYQIEVDSIEKVKQCIQEELEIKNETQFVIQMKKEQVPQIVKKLVESNIKVYEIHEKQMSLEDVFLKKTGGNQID